MQRLCDAAGLGLDIVDVAGITGLSFRTALCKRAIPASTYHTWSWSHYFRAWLDSLGLDADVAEHNTYLGGFNAWLDRQHADISATLDRGFPVLYWDNLAFGLIVGMEGQDYLVSGIPGFTIHPQWQEQAEAREVIARAIVPGERSTLEPKVLPRHNLAPQLDENALFIYVRGLSTFRHDEAMLEGLYAGWTELSGMLEYPRFMDSPQSSYEAQFGTQALERWSDELRDNSFHAFGQIAAVQIISEARRWAYLYLKRLLDFAAPEQQGQLQQLVEFFRRIADFWRPALAAYGLPLDEKEQRLDAKRMVCREAIYQARQTEETASRVLGAVVQQLFGQEV